MWVMLSRGAAVDAELVSLARYNDFGDEAVNLPAPTKSARTNNSLYKLTLDYLWGDIRVW